MIKADNKTYTNDPKGYYAELEVSYNADDAEIKQKYRDQAKLWHPDHNTSKEALEKFQKISVAYDILKDDDTRLMYDLLAQAYPKEKFPDMFALKIYKNQKGQEDVSVRAISLQRVIGKFTKYSCKTSQEICSFMEAKIEILKTSFLNLLLGWWSLKAIPKNFTSLVANYKNINENIQENLTLLIHNAYAYHQEKKDINAYISAIQALDYANKSQKALLQKFIKSLKTTPKVKIPNWNFAMLKHLQLLLPIVFLAIAFMPLSSKVMTSAELNAYFSDKPEEMNYYQEVKFRSGGKTVDDVVVSKILNIAPNTEDLNMLYHVTEMVNVMYGPDDDFDLLKKLKTRTTVRVTGFTPDKTWYRVMLDNGDMGFVKSQYIKKGIGRDIPEGSKIYTGIKLK